MTMGALAMFTSYIAGNPIAVMGPGCRSLGLLQFKRTSLNVSATSKIEAIKAFIQHYLTHIFHH
jgi:hypothetical protein